MLWQALEADKVGVFVSNLLALDQEKVLLLHHRFENRLRNCASHSNEEFCILEIRCELVEDARLAAER